MKIAFVAGGVGFGILGLSLGANPFGFAAILLASSSFLMALILWLGSLRWKRDPYDLKELRRIQENDDRHSLEQELAELDSAGNAVCLNCGTHFDPKLSFCPRCRKGIFS